MPVGCIQSMSSAREQMAASQRVAEARPLEIIAAVAAAAPPAALPAGSSAACLALRFADQLPASLF